MILTNRLRQVPIYRTIKEYEDGSSISEVIPSGYKLQQWWSCHYAPEANPDGGEWRDVEIAE